MPMMICQQCGREYFAKRRNQKYCSRACKDAAAHKDWNGAAFGKDSLCWNCKKTNAIDCPWFSKKEEPVPGWKATPTVIKGQSKDKGTDRETYPSYIVHECPLFEAGR